MGGRAPVVMAWSEARAEEMFTTRGKGDSWRRGMARVVRRAAEVRFVFSVEV